MFPSDNLVGLDRKSFLFLLQDQDSSKHFFPQHQLPPWLMWDSQLRNIEQLSWRLALKACTETANGDSVDQEDSREWKDYLEDLAKRVTQSMPTANGQNCSLQ